MRVMAYPHVSCDRQLSIAELLGVSAQPKHPVVEYSSTGVTLCDGNSPSVSCSEFRLCRNVR